MLDKSFVVKITKISIIIRESFLDKTVNNDVRNKNIGTSQFARLEERAETRADKARVKNKKQKRTLQ